MWFDGEACRTVPVPTLYPDEMKYFPPYNSKEARARRDGMCNGAFVYGTKGVIEYGHHGANYLRMLPGLTLEKLRAEGVGCGTVSITLTTRKSPVSASLSRMWMPCGYWSLV